MNKIIINEKQNSFILRHTKEEYLVVLTLFIMILCYLVFPVWGGGL